MTPAHADDFTTAFWIENSNYVLSECWGWARVWTHAGLKFAFKYPARTLHNHSGEEESGASFIVGCNYWRVQSAEQTRQNSLDWTLRHTCGILDLRPVRQQISSRMNVCVFSLITRRVSLFHDFFFLPHIFSSAKTKTFMLEAFTPSQRSLFLGWKALAGTGCISSR